MANMDSMIDKGLPVQLQIKQAAQLEELIMNAAVSSLYDGEMSQALREAFVRPSANQIINELAGTESGGKLFQSALTKLTEPTDPARKWFEPGACFAAGTLVHTKDGLKPIEQIKVGDYVLSKSENGGEQEYKRVLKTFAHEPTTVKQVGYIHPDKPNYLNYIVSTINHPFWVVDKGWTAAKDLPTGSINMHFKLELADGIQVPTCNSGPIYISELSGVGWVPNYMGDVTRPGALWDYINNKLVTNEVMALEEIQEFDLDDPYFKLPVYNLEVEDFHTYYVGEHGVWVHNTNCGGLSFEVNPPAPALSARLMEKLQKLVRGS